VSAGSAAVELSGCTVVLGRNRILDDLSLTVPAGSVVGIRGFNGSGKSTVLRVIAGLIAPAEGSVTVFGEPPTVRVPRPRIGAAIDAPALYGWMSARGYLRTMLDLSGVPDRGESASALERFGLADVGRKRIFQYSQGMKKRLSLAAATLCDPPLVLLDEPTNALDRQGEQQVARWVADHRSSGGTLVLATHRPFDVHLCDEVHDLDQGSFVQPEEVRVDG